VRFGPLKGAIVNNILVGNLSLNVTEQDIRSLFDKHGVVRRCKMMTDRWTGLSRGFGFIQMKTDSEATEAIVALNGTNLNGKTLQVNQARPQLHRTGKSKAGAQSVTDRNRKG
jgi:RNA recognition motif-containing protein